MLPSLSAAVKTAVAEDWLALNESCREWTKARVRKLEETIQKIMPK